jgi:hypothetical protein
LLPFIPDLYAAKRGINGVFSLILYVQHFLFTVVQYDSKRMLLIYQVILKSGETKVFGEGPQGCTVERIFSFDPLDH